MKIAVIGKGTASIITTLVLLQHGHEVVIYYDPNSKHLPVGESTTPHISFLLYEVLGIDVNDMVENDIASLKVGVKFINWGKGKEFVHNFRNQLAFHLENEDFNPFIHRILEENNLVKYIPQRVEQTVIENDQVFIKDQAYDFIIFCSGWTDGDHYIKPIFETVNSVVMYPQNSVDKHNLHTIHRATKDGWQLGLPYPNRNLTKCGYLFDRNLISVDEVKEMVKSNMSVQWTPRYSKSLLQNSFTAFNGNRLFFIEPLHALSFYYIKLFTEKICKYLENPNIETFHSINSEYLYEMWVYQLSLAYHYQYGSIHDSVFWNHITTKAQTFISSINNGNRDIFLQNFVTDLMFKGKTEYSKIGSFGATDFKQLHCGMTGEKLEDIVKNYHPHHI